MARSIPSPERRPLATAAKVLLYGSLLSLLALVVAVAVTVVGHLVAVLSSARLR